MKNFESDKQLESNANWYLVRKIIRISLIVMLIIFFLLFLLVNCYDVLNISNMNRQGLCDSTQNKAVIFMIICAGLLIAIVGSSDSTKSFYKRFSEINGLEFSPTSWMSIEGLIFNIGNDKKMKEVITGKIDDLKFTLFNYYFKYDTAEISRTIFKIKIKNHSSKIVFTADKFLIDTFVNDYFKNVSKINLDGELGDTHSLHSEKDFEMEALEIFSQELLLEMKDKYPEFTIDINNKRVMIYSERIIKTKKEIYKICELGEYLVKNVIPIIEKNEKGTLALEAANSNA